MGPICQKSSSCHSFCKTRKRVQWTRFLFLQTEFIELNFHTYKSSSMNSVSILADRVHWTWFVLKETTILVGYVHRRHHSKKHFRHTKKPNTQKKLSSNFKHTVTLSYSLSLSVSPSHSLSRALSHSHTLIPSLSLRCRHCRRLLPSPSLPLAFVAVVGDGCFRTASSTLLSISFASNWMPISEFCCCKNSALPVGNWCCWDGSERQGICWFCIQRNRVQRTRFLSLENESIGLGFKAWKPSPMDSVLKLGNWVLWTHFLGLVELDFSPTWPL